MLYIKTPLNRSCALEEEGAQFLLSVGWGSGVLEGCGSNTGRGEGIGSRMDGGGAMFPDGAQCAVCGFGYGASAGRGSMNEDGDG